MEIGTFSVFTSLVLIFCVAGLGYFLLPLRGVYHQIQNLNRR